MGKLFYIMGKSSTGKDTIFREVVDNRDLGLQRLMMYTTRPIREKEENGREYFFVDDAETQALEAAHKIIEMRTYHTMHGLWKYFTVDDAHTDLEHCNYIAVGTLESYAKIRDYYGADRVLPIYIEVDDGLRLERALKRERKPQNRRFEEMCRRFLADAVDFSEENLAKAGITRRFCNDSDREECMQEVEEFIRASCQEEGKA